MHLILSPTPLCSSVTETLAEVSSMQRCVQCKMWRWSHSSYLAHIKDTLLPIYILQHRTLSLCMLFSALLHISTWRCLMFDWPHTTEAKSCKSCCAKTNHDAVQFQHPSCLIGQASPHQSQSADPQCHCQKETVCAWYWHPPTWAAHERVGGRLLMINLSDKAHSFSSLKKLVS